MSPILFLVPAAALALAAFKKRDAAGKVTIGKPSPGGAAPLPKGRDKFPATGKLPDKPAGSKPRPRPNNPVTGKPKPTPIDSLPIKSPGQPTGPQPRPGAPIGTIPGGPSPELLERIAKALSSGDEDVIRALADELRRLGFDEQANDLDKAADAIELAKRTNPLPGLPPGLTPPPFVVNPPPAIIPHPIPTPRPPRHVPPPAVVIPSEPFDPDPRRNLALKVQRMLALSPKGSEDTALLKQWQTQEGCKPADGLYGYCSGIAMLKYNLVPPKPRTTLSAQRRKDWTGNLTWQARKDPARAAEYLAAAKLD